MSQRDRKEFGVVPGSRLDAALRQTVRGERRHLLAIMSQRAPAIRFNHVEVETSDGVRIETEVAERRHRPTRRQRKWAARFQRSLARRGVAL